MDTSNTNAGPLSDYLGVSKHACPDCAGPLHRTGRRPMDHLLCLLVQVRRYRCHRFSCQWEGNFRASAETQDEAVDTGLLAQQEGRRRAPASFIVHMVVVALGVLLVLVVSLTESQTDHAPPRGDVATSLPAPR